MNQLYIRSDNGTEHPVGDITFLSNKTFSGKVGGTVEVHGVQISEGFYDVPALKIRVHLPGTYSASTLWDFTLEAFQR